MASPLLSVITVSYNSIIGLRRTSESLRFLNRGVETILVDGNSTDGTAGWIRSPDCNYSKVISEPDSGIYDAMNKGIALARGQYLLFMNCGDRVASELSWDRLRVSLESQVAIFIGNLRTDDGGNPSFTQANFSIKHLYNSSLPHQAAFVPREFFQAIGVYDVNYPVSADQEWFLRALRKRLPFRALGYVVADYAGGGLSERPESQRRIRQERSKMLRDHFGAPWAWCIKAAYLIRYWGGRLKDTVKSIKTLWSKKRR